MYVQDLNEGLTEGAAESQEFDFDAQASDPVGAGWGMDDLDSMLLQGMKKKRRQRTAGMVGLVILCLGVGVLIGQEAAKPPSPPQTQNDVVQGCVAFPPPPHTYTQCSNRKDVTCSNCTLTTGERNCPTSCTCVARCEKGWNPTDALSPYTTLCQPNGEWYIYPPYDKDNNPPPACVDVDECRPASGESPCQNGARCFATTPVPVGTYSCVCRPGYSGENCEIDEDECNKGSPLNPCQHGGTCYESSDRSLPAGWDPVPAGQYKCDCSTAAPVPFGNGQGGKYTGTICTATSQACERKSPCKNEAECTDIGLAPSGDPLLYGYGAYECACLQGYEGHDCGTLRHATDPYETVTESRSVANSQDTGEELTATGAVHVDDNDLQFFDADTDCAVGTSATGSDPCLQTIGVLFRNVSIPRQTNFTAPPLVRDAKLAFKVKDVIEPQTNSPLKVRIDVLLLADAPTPLSTDTHGISSPTGSPCNLTVPPSGSCFWPENYYPASNPSNPNTVVWDVHAEDHAEQVIETGGARIDQLLNYAILHPQWQPGNAMMFKFTLLPPPPPWDAPPPLGPPPPPPPRGLRVFEANKDGYPKLTYTVCTTATCRLPPPPPPGTPPPPPPPPPETTCPLSQLSVHHSKRLPICTFNGTAIEIGDKTGLSVGTRCHLDCCNTYNPEQGKSSDYTCKASGAWEDGDGDSPDFRCNPATTDECSTSYCQGHGTCTPPEVTGDTPKDEDQCPIVSFTCSCTGDWTGQACQTQEDDCASNPCKHGATCIDGQKEYTCNCAAGYESGDGGNCMVDINECASNPCQNDGVCRDSSSPQLSTEKPVPPAAYRCRCHGQWHGSDCEIATDNCNPQPCLHACPPHVTTGCSHCTTTDDGFSCDCAPGLEGNVCDQDIDECSSRPCQNGGMCSDSTGHPSIPLDEFRCNCTHPYVGTMCQTTEDVCSSSPCQNGGTCADSTEDDGTTIFVCTCTSGYGGDTCADESYCNGGDDSDPPCTNGGTCVDEPTSADGYTCDCAGTDYHGARCETITDDCDTDKNNCKNGINEDGDLVAAGTCVDGINTVTCTCHPGFSGPSCEDSSPVCDNDPCQNGGTCTRDTSARSGYTCQCAAGFTGGTCSNQEDFCESNPCQNGGTCSNADGGFTCTCAPDTPTAGDTCELCGPGEQPNDVQTSCQNCPAGRFGTDGSCAPCPGGMEPDSQRIQCVACAAGKATVTSGSGKCETCSPGKEPAPAGTNATAQPAGWCCQDCTGNKYSSGGVQCIACEGGKSPHADHARCDTCAAGRAGQTGLCDKCPAGKAPSDGSTTCTKCGPNLVSADGGSCVPCPVNQTANKARTGCDGSR